MVEKNSFQIQMFSEFFEKEEKKIKKMKNPPQYDKFYYLCVFDDIKYHKLLKDFIKENNLKSVYDIGEEKRKQIRDLCYSLDINGQKQFKGDEKHIYRVPALHRIYEEVYRAFYHKLFFHILGQEELIIKQEKSLNIDGLVFSPCEKQAEINGFQMFSIKDRLKSHIKLLKLTRAGMALNKAITQIKAEFGI